MTDKELLELAAKAAGVKLWIDAGNRYWGGSSQWNPLEFDGDALRLAVKLELNLWICKAGTDVEIDSKPSEYISINSSNCNNDPYAAARRAIVRAAAEIVKGMK